MSRTFRKEVLMAFKNLHRTKNEVFKDDTYALALTRQKINEEFKKNKHVTEDGSIKELLKLSSEVENELRTRVIQAKEKEPGRYEVRMRPGIQMQDNVSYFGPTKGIEEIKKTGKCCQEKNK